MSGRHRKLTCRRASNCLMLVMWAWFVSKRDLVANVSWRAATAAAFVERMVIVVVVVVGAGHLFKVRR